MGKNAGNTAETAETTTGTTGTTGTAKTAETTAGTAGTAGTAETAETAETTGTTGTTTGTTGKRTKEDKHASFRALASTRVSNALHDMGLVGNLAGSNYYSTEEEKAKIVAALQKGVDDVKSAFENKGKAAGFSL